MAIKVGLLGATGVVGQEVIRVLEQRQFPLHELRLIASARSKGRKMPFHGRNLNVEEVSAEAFKDLDIVIASAGSSAIKEHISAIRASRAVLIDNSSAFRLEDSVPLVVPEVNCEESNQHNGIIANPNCVAIMLTVVIAPLHKAAPIKRISVTTYQSASGAGIAAMNELETQTRAVLSGEAAIPRALPHPIAFNVFSHNSSVESNGYNGEENKIILETRKILRQPAMFITATCVRVPVLRAHSMAINLTFHQPMPEDRVRTILSSAPGLTIIDDRVTNTFPMPLSASGGDDVLVGRIRQDQSQNDNCGIELFACGDQLRKGAALNAVQIAEHLVSSRSLPPRTR